MIEFQGVTKVFQGSGGQEITAVCDLDLVVEEGKTHCLLGTSGCGKTTTMKMVNRLLEPTSGTILLDGTDVARVDVIPLRRSIGYVIQKGGLFPHMTVAQNVGLLCRLEAWPEARIRERIDELLGLVNLDPAQFAHRYPRELSGGQRQRVGVARALALDPRTILMDEPFSALDPITRRGIHEEFLRLTAAVRKTILLVTHDIAEALRLGDRISLMDGGRLVQTDTPDELTSNPATDFVRDFLTGHIDGADG